MSRDALTHAIRERFGWDACTARCCRRDSADRRTQIRTARRRLRAADEVAEALADAEWLADEHNIDPLGECTDYGCPRCSAAAEAELDALIAAAEARGDFAEAETLTTFRDFGGLRGRATRTAMADRDVVRDGVLVLREEP
jgi:cell division septum initiation protein DivIVA